MLTHMYYDNIKLNYSTLGNLFEHTTIIITKSSIQIDYDDPNSVAFYHRQYLCPVRNFSDDTKCEWAHNLIHILLSYIYIYMHPGSQHSYRDRHILVHLLLTLSIAQRYCPISFYLFAYVNTYVI